MADLIKQVQIKLTAWYTEIPILFKDFFFKFWKFQVFEVKSWPGSMVHTYNPSTWDVEARKSGEYKASVK